MRGPITLDHQARQQEEDQHHQDHLFLFRQMIHHSNIAETSANHNID